MVTITNERLELW